MINAYTVPMNSLPPGTPRVVVSHPGRQHSYQTALALFRAGMLEAYWTGLPCRPEHSRWLPGAIKSRTTECIEFPLPKNVVKWNPAAPLLRRIGSGLLGGAHGAWLEYGGYVVFDGWAARRLQTGTVDAVICYEMAAFKSFVAAKRRGTVTILDAASIHHTAQDEASPFAEPLKLHELICRRKSAEIDLADYILTLSTLARQTYVDAGVPPEKIIVIPLGVDIELFSPRTDVNSTAPHGFRFLFVGHVKKTKGFDLLARAFAKVHAAAPDVELLVIGAAGDASGLLNGLAGVKYLGKRTQQELAHFYRSSDCFVLPSRIDSYGMVVTEALACGVPTIVSDMVGAKDSITPGINGWIVPFNDVDALARQMKWCAENRDQVREMRSKARVSALKLGWNVYHEKLTQTIGRLALQSRRDAPPTPG